MPTNDTNAASSTPNDLYDILSVARDATPKTLRAAYKTAARAHHPDGHVNKPAEEQEAEANAFKKIQNAYDVLSDPNKRQLYDAYGHDGVASSSASTADTAEMFETMFNVPKQPRGVRGGAMFVDGDHFFQRHFDAADVDAMRQEMRDGLPETEMSRRDGGALAASTHLPKGAWEVRLVEADAEAGTLTVTLWTDANKTADADTAEPTLRLTRVFTTPAHLAGAPRTDLHAAAVALDESAGVLTVTAPMVGSPLPYVKDDAVGKGRLSPRAVDELPVHDASFDVSAGFSEGAAPKPNRAARRRSHKQGAMRPGFLNDAKPRATKAHAAAEPMEVGA